MVVPTGETPEPVLPRFYAGRDVLITGATGFMGKVLVERLLWTCPEVGHLYLLMRDKRGQPPQKRLEQLKQSQVFECVRERAPHQLDKLQCVAGDISLPLLGLGSDQILQLRKVSVVFHGAATVKFCEPLADAFNNNVASVLHLMDLCDELPALQALVHVSTAYTNVERQHVEERVYAPPHALSHVLAVLDALPPKLLNQITPQYIFPKPNTYVFTKSLAEAAVHERANRHYSVAIFRPSIVVSSDRHPFPGWVEGLAGASGVVAGMARGALRVFRIDAATRADLLPVDVAIDNMIAVGWETATDKVSTSRVYNCGCGAHAQSWRQFRQRLFSTVEQWPFDHTFYSPHTYAVKNKYVFKSMELVLQTAPLYLAEYVLKLFRVNTRMSLVSVSSRLSAMSRALAFFTCREWRYDARALPALRRRLQRSDGHVYHFDIRDVDWEAHTREFVRGVRRHVLRDTDASLARARTRLHRLRVIHRALLLLMAILTYKLFGFIYRKLT